MVRNGRTDRLEMRIEPKLKKELMRLAKKDRRSLSDSVHYALSLYVEDRKTWEPK